jgi:hypothetical protein
MRNRLLGWATFFTLAALLSWMPGAQASTEELEEEHSLSTEFETPHTKWAQPYAGGKLRALFFIDMGYCGTWPREIVELKQRFDIDAEAVFWAKIVDTTRTHWHGGAAGVARMKRLLEKPWDCYVFINLAPDRLPPEQQYRALEGVTKGAGIVLMGKDDPRVLKPARKLPLPAFLREGVPLLELPFVQASYLPKPEEGAPSVATVAERMVACYQVREGRGVRLPPRPEIDYRPGWETEYDYWQSRVGRALLWAAGREPKASLTVEMSERALARASLPRKQAAVISWEGLDTKARPVISLRLRGADGSSRVLPEVSRPQERGQATVEIPLLPAGEYYVDALARGSNGIATWASTGFRVECPRSIKEITLEQPYSEAGGKLAGRVTVEGTPTLAGERVRIDLCDRRNRVLMRHEAPLTGSSVAFSFPVPEWFPMLVRVEATLISGNEAATRAYTYFNVTKRNRDQFNFLVWDTPNGTLAPYAEESLVRNGMTLQLRSGTPPRYVQAYDVAWVPYTTRIMSPKSEQGIMKPCCWHDEEAITRHVQKIIEPYGESRQIGVFAYSLGDEGVTRGACLHPACLAAFRKYLREEYGTIAALNASWGTQYTSFDQVNLDPVDDSDAAVAKTRGNYPRWYDRQAFHSYSFVRLCDRFVEAFARLDPKALVGFEGAGTFNAGDDYDAIVRTNGFWAPYPDMGDEVIRSLAPKGFPRANWMGYTRDADSLLSKYWRMVTRGCDSVWYWRWDGVGRFHGWLAPHLGPYEATKEVLRDTQVVRDGLGTLLIHSEMQHDGIAFVYSMPSAYATRVGKGPAYGNYLSAHTAWSRTVRDLGLQYRYVTDRMLRRGEFNPSEFKVVVLSRTEALGPEEAAVLRRFVENGGTLIADVRPGLYDGHCKPRERGVLDDLFGISRTALDADPARGEAAFTGGEAPLRLANALCDPTVRLAGGQAAGKCGEAPLLISRAYGKGRAILLNAPIHAFPGIWVGDTSEAVAGLFARLFADAGVMPQVRATNRDGARERNLETVRWRNGDTTLVALFREAGQASKAQLLLSEATHVYDLRSGRALGKTARVTCDLRPGRATFLVLSPTPVQPARLTLSAKALKPGQTGEVTLRAGSPGGLQAFLLTARQPDGTEADWLRRVVMVPPAGASVPLPVAENDPTGQWELSAKELFTGRVVKARYTVAR